MAVNLNSGGGRHRPGRTRPMAEINVTPLVDVMLVLLIVFMVAAPLLTVGVAVDLPETAADPDADSTGVVPRHRPPRAQGPATCGLLRAKNRSLPESSF